MAKAKKKAAVPDDAAKHLPRFTIQMMKPLYKILHTAAIAHDFKMYELVNHLLILGLKEWHRTLDKEKAKEINLEKPDLAEAYAMSTVIAGKSRTKK